MTSANVVAMRRGQGEMVDNIIVDGGTRQGFMTRRVLPCAKSHVVMAWHKREQVRCWHCYSSGKENPPHIGCVCRPPVTGGVNCNARNVNC
jgi:hypothetical protein